MQPVSAFDPLFFAYAIQSNLAAGNDPESIAIELGGTAEMTDIADQQPRRDFLDTIDEQELDGDGVERDAVYSVADEAYRIALRNSRTYKEYENTVANLPALLERASKQHVEQLVQRCADAAQRRLHDPALLAAASETTQLVAYATAPDRHRLLDADEFVNHSKEYNRLQQLFSRVRESLPLIKRLHDELRQLAMQQMPKAAPPTLATPSPRRAYYNRNEGVLLEGAGGYLRDLLVASCHRPTPDFSSVISKAISSLRLQNMTLPNWREMEQMAPQELDNSCTLILLNTCWGFLLEGKRFEEADIGFFVWQAVSEAREEELPAGSEGAVIAWLGRHFTGRIAHFMDLKRYLRGKCFA